MAGQFAIVTGASTGIGLELARICAREGFDLLVTADESDIHDAAQLLREEKGLALWKRCKLIWPQRRGLTRFMERPRAGRSMC